jgi:hypothetical protein
MTTNIVPLSDLIGNAIAAPAAAVCPLCHDVFGTEKERSVHLDREHPNWAVTMMFTYLEQIPRENG